MKLTKQGFVTEVRRDGKACVRFGTGVTDVEWVQANGHSVGDKVVLVYQTGVSYGLWVIAQESERKVA